nr:inorganic phosphate transporter 1-4-like [Ipomoea batatas]
MGFFTDAYDLFCISLVTKLLGRIYYHVDGAAKPGIGGDYPLSATIMSEYANKKTRGAFIAAVFAMQGFGILAGGMVAIIVSASFKSAFPAPDYAFNAVRSTVPQADYVWRIILMFGALPAALTYYWRNPKKTDAGYPPGIGVRNSLIVLGCVNFLGMLFTLLVPESKGKSLEEMSRENGEEEESGSEMRAQGRTVPV